MRNPKILQIRRSLINELSTDITKLVQAYHVDKDNPANIEKYNSIKERVQGMTDVLFSYNPTTISRRVITDPNDPKYDPIAVFNDIILPLYRSEGFFEEFNPVNDEAIEKLRSRIIDKRGLTFTDMVLELCPKWPKRITLKYDYEYNHPENGDASFPVLGLSGNLQRMLFSNYISSIFPKGDVYTHIYRSDYEPDYVEMHLALRNSAIVKISEILYENDDPEETGNEYDPVPYIKYNDDVPTRLADAVSTMLKGTKTTIIVNRYTLPY